MIAIKWVAYRILKALETFFNRTTTNHYRKMNLQKKNHNYVTSDAVKRLNHGRWKRMQSHLVFRIWLEMEKKTGAIRMFNERTANNNEQQSKMKIIIISTDKQRNVIRRFKFKKVSADFFSIILLIHMYVPMCQAYEQLTVTRFLR